MSPATETRRPEPVCSTERCLGVLADRWSFLIIREALMAGAERFADFQRALGIAPNVLTDRLEHLVKAGVLTKRSYQEPGSRTRRSYHLTPAGRDLAVPLAALQQWGDLHDPPSTGPSVLRRSRSGKPRPGRVRRRRRGGPATGRRELHRGRGGRELEHI
jgi:DNA-binding HxlR family transcriptional regulator